MFKALFVRASGPPYWIGNLILFILVHILNYRKKVITDNLARAFPSKTSKEINVLRRKFYRQFSTTLAEMMYAYAYPDKIVDKVTYDNYEEMNNIMREGKSVLLLGGHFYNWEWVGMNLNKICDFPIYGIYKPLTNKYFDDYLTKTRSKLGVHLISMRTSKKFLDLNEKNNNSGLYALASDQSPSHLKKAIWQEFFGVQSPFFPGMEFFVETYDLPVFFLSVRCIKKGHYHGHVQKLEPVENSLTKALAQLLEKEIRARPEGWLWSHNRWKHAKE